MRRTNEQAREEITRRYRAHLQARARFRRQLFVSCFAFVICIGAVLAFGMLPADREKPPVVSDSPSEDGSALQESSAWHSDEESQGSTASSEPEVLKPEADDSDEEGPETWDPNSFDEPAEGPTEDFSEDFSEESSEVSYDEDDLMAGITRFPYIEEEKSPSLLEDRIEFAFDLLRASLDQKGESGVLVSPLSADLVLGMIAGGAAGDTLAEIENAVIGGEAIDVLNRYHYTYMEDNRFLAQYMDSRVPKISAAMWFDRSDEVSGTYLQKMLSYYDASAYKADFDDRLVQEINGWVSEHTDGKISRLYDSLSPDTKAVFVNTVLLDILWDNEPVLQDGVFTAANGAKRDVTLLCSENDRYIEDASVVGIQRYLDRHSLIVLMPKEGIDVYEYAASLDKEDFLMLLFSAQERVTGCIPQFAFRQNLDLSGVLPKLGISSAFDRNSAAFEILQEGGLCLNQILQESVLELTQEGLHAAGVAAPMAESETVVIDRPFVYLILDRDVMPIFMGVLTDIPQ